MDRVCVFCGSNPGRDPAYEQAAHAFGERLVAEGLGLVYGGGDVGLMGAIADTVLAGGGEVRGVIPEALVEREVAHRGLTELHVVATMHERKALMAELADGFVALPGGLGTLEELFEVWTWGQLGIHPKPCALLDVAGYYESLITFLDRAVADGFVRRQHRDVLIVGTDPAEVLARMRAYRAPTLQKWLRAEEV